MLNDIRYAVRLLGRSPVFTAAAIGTLALGIGATTAIFALFQAIVLKPLPIEDPARVVSLHRHEQERLSRTFVYPAYQRFREQTRDVFAGVAASGASGFRVSVAGTKLLAIATFVTEDYFDVIGVAPARGRLFTADEHAPGAAPAVIVTDAFWRAKMGADPGVLGSEIRVADTRATIVGITPRGFGGLKLSSPPDMFLPLAAASMVLPPGNYFDEVAGLGYSPQHWLDVTGRLKPGVTFQQAEARISAIAIDRIARETSRMRLVRASDAALSPHTRTITTRFATLLAAVVSMVLLIGCANLTGLVLARNEQRRREVAVRLALGARTGRVVRLFLAESVLLSTAGALAGLAVAWWWLQALAAFVIPGNIDIETLQLGLTRQVMLFAAVAAGFTSVVTGLLPALAGSRLDLVSGLKDRAGATSRRSGFMRGALVAAQVAISLVLIVGAGLFVRSLRTALATDVGTDVERLAYATVSIWGTGYDEARLTAFSRAVVEALTAVPGVERASFGAIPLVGFPGSTPAFGIDGVARQLPQTYLYSGGPQYFETLGIELTTGRAFGPQDQAGTPPVVVVNEAFARHAWPGVDPIGRHVSVRPRGVDMEVIGVARDAKYGTLREAGRPVIYVPFHLGNWQSSATFFVRAAGDPASSVAAIQREIRRIDPDLATIAAGTLKERVGELAMTQRIGASLLGWFSAVAFALAVLGVYGLIAYAVARRTVEIGIRMALGGSAQNVVRLMMVRALVPVGAGLAAGLAGAYLLTRLAAAFLFGIEPHDPVSFAGAALLLVLGVLIASYIPARRAARVDPVIALRTG